MRKSDIFLRAGRNLKQSKTRTILTALAIAVGATTITLAMAAGAAGRAYISKQAEIRGLGEFAFIFVSKSADVQDAPQEGIQPYQEPQQSDTEGSTPDDSALKTEDLSQLEAMAGVKQVIPDYRAYGLYLQKAGSSNKFTAPEISTSIRPTNADEIEAGTHPENLIGKVVISHDFTEAFDVSADELIGKKIQLAVENGEGKIKQYEFSVAAVTKQSYSTNSLIIDQSDAKAIAEWQTGETPNVYSAILIPDGSVEMSRLVDSLTNDGYSAFSSEFGREAAMDAINIAQWGLVGFGAVALLAAIFGIINTQYISVLERTQQIGLMKAVGGSRKDVARLFRYEAAWVGLLGGIVGVMIAYLISLASPVIKSSIGINDADLALFIFEPVTVVIIIVSLVLIAVLSGYFPSRKAAKLDPIEALRTE